MQLLNGYGEQIAAPDRTLMGPFWKAEDSLGDNPAHGLHPDFVFHNPTPQNSNVVAFLSWADPALTQGVVEAIIDQGGKPRGVVMGGWVAVRREDGTITSALDIMSFDHSPTKSALLAMDLWRFATNGSSFSRTELGQAAIRILRTTNAMPMPHHLARNKHRYGKHAISLHKNQATRQ